MSKKGKTTESGSVQLNERLRKRIHEVPTLAHILPLKSPSSGREFARIVNLLIFHSGRREGKTVTLFDDRAGDVEGLDAFEEDAAGITGYQHKFFPSPLSTAHRKEIVDSLAKSLDAGKSSKKKVRHRQLKKWILVTPEDFVESAARKDQGDVSWFANLKTQLRLPFQIEHWGHTQLLKLMLETPAIGLYYFPELFPDGVNLRKSITGVRAQYDSTLREEHGRIEFVGMSIYKAEAAHTVPMERIYIPLSAIPNDADEENPHVQRQDPAEFLARGSRHVVLGHPGSGKTTLLRLLALLGQSESLQRRLWERKKVKPFVFKPDERLPVFVTLRRYADAVKANDNLSLIEYIRSNIEADFSIPGVSTEFLEYYLESGQAILLFDGLDELPTSSFKNRIRNRVRNLAATFPGNTIVVTSRVFGYEGPVRFDSSEFAHHRLAKLRDEEIEQFVKDWYDARLEKPHDRRDYLDSLLAILRQEKHEGIRELARNPLLLTIMVLVHRIDAVLPDERHVLYQKCTETLLNTWHTWKFHDADTLHRAKVDQLNMQRLQAIAYWMHHEMGGEDTRQQAVVGYQALHRVLSEHIAGETPPDPEYPPDVIATAFLEFVQDRAGLLVEIGDRQFSFVHLTFQEYLTAARIKTLAELNGVRQAWDEEISTRCRDPRWREVIRLLVAGYGQQAQEFLFNSILDCAGTDPNVAQLLGGLLLDGVVATVTNREQVLRVLLRASAAPENTKSLQNTMAILRDCRERMDPDWAIIKNGAFGLSGSTKSDYVRTGLRLVSVASGLGIEETWQSCGKGSPRETALLSLFSGRPLTASDIDLLTPSLQILWPLLDAAAFHSPATNLFACALQSLTSATPKLTAGRGFDALLSLFGVGLVAPLLAFSRNMLFFSPETPALRFGRLFSAVDQIDAKAQDRDLALARARVRDLARARALARMPDRNRTRDRARDRALDRVRARVRARDRALDWDPDRDRSLGLGLGLHLSLVLDRLQDCPDSALAVWAILLASPELTTSITETLSAVFELKPTALWSEAVHVLYLPNLAGRFILVDPLFWRNTRAAIRDGNPRETDLLAASWQLMFDGVLFVLGYHAPDKRWLAEQLGYNDEQIEEHCLAASESAKGFDELAGLTRKSEEAPLRIAHCLRDLCYGFENRAKDLNAMLESNDEPYREIFQRCYWRD